jgi:hypothetical protein
LVASGTALADGRNEFIDYLPLVTGSYRARLSSESDTIGEYVLSVTGNSFIPPPFQVTTTNPPDGAILGAAPTTFTVDFNDVYLGVSVQASDLKINGADAVGVTLVDGDTVSFTLPGGIGEGTHSVTIAAGAIQDLQGTPLNAFSATFVADLTPPRVTATSIAPNGSADPGSLTYEVTFSKPIKVSNIAANDFSLQGNLRAANYFADADRGNHRRRQFHRRSWQCPGRRIHRHVPLRRRHGRWELCHRLQPGCGHRGLSHAPNS